MFRFQMLSTTNSADIMPAMASYGFEPRGFKTGVRHNHSARALKTERAFLIKGQSAAFTDNASTQNTVLGLCIRMTPVNQNDGMLISDNKAAQADIS
ncbi:hypothetical protein JL49_04305 [Pseudoalteromonas luteoviolacea]|nr:hypothetical protein JL49_04305 [Pseudoalteromonas luteoviolacea]